MSSTASMFGMTFPDAGGNAIELSTSLGDELLQHDWSNQAIDNQENYESMMSNTGYQRAMSSMEAAGLNPLLAYQQGGLPAPSVGQGMVPGLPAVGGTASVMSPGNMAPATKANLDADTQSKLANATYTLSSIPNLASSRALQAAQKQLASIEGNLESLNVGAKLQSMTAAEPLQNLNAFSQALGGGGSLGAASLGMNTAQSLGGLIAP